MGSTGSREAEGEIQYGETYTANRVLHIKIRPVVVNSSRLSVLIHFQITTRPRWSSKLKGSTTPRMAIVSSLPWVVSQKGRLSIFRTRQTLLQHHKWILRRRARSLLIKLVAT